MPSWLTKSLGLRILLSALFGLLGLAAIAVLSLDVATKMRQLNSANSDNVQWSLTQAEVDFLEFSNQLNITPDSPDAALGELRRKFDVFYSRISTLDKASVYAPLRATPGFSEDLLILQQFLERSVTVIDASDAILLTALPEMRRAVKPLRANVRALAHEGLGFFSTSSDNRRNAISATLFQLASVVGILLVAMFILAIYLATLNRQNIRRRAEVVEASERMKTITDTALDAVIVSDSYGHILTFNPAAEQIFGYRAGDVIGENLSDLIVPDHLRAGHDAGMERMRRGGERHIVGEGRVHLDAKRANGDLFPAEFAIQSAETANGEIFIAFLRDISQRVKAQEELVHARDRALAGEKAKTDFLATMSHEIRTPLNGLLGNLALLEDTGLTSRQARYIKHMNTSGKLLMRHITDVLDLTKYDAGKLQLRPEPMDIGLLLQDIVDNQSGAAARNATTIAWGWRGKPMPWINADHDRLQHILMNIIGNAVKFTKEGEVRIEIGVTPGSEPDEASSTEAQPEMCISITDTGLGMDADLQSRIFDDFTTGDAAYDRNVGGTGLGLGIAQRFVKSLGGAITVKSALGEGSCFTVRFPVVPADPPRDTTVVSAQDRAQAENAASIRSAHKESSAALDNPDDDDEFAPLLTEASRAEDDGASHQILLVDDNGINRVVAREMLRGMGHQVTEVQNGQEAVEICLKRRFDLILMDISMPVMDGRTATRTIRAGKGRNADTPIIALTANAMIEEQRAYLSDGMNDILTKPLMRAGLKRVVEAHIAPVSAAPEPLTQTPAEAPLETPTEARRETPAAQKGETAPPSPQGVVSAPALPHAPASDLAPPLADAEVDPTHLDELREMLGEKALATLVTRHCGEIEALLQQLHPTAPPLPLPEIAARAHKVAGSAAALGAKGLRSGLITVERAAKDGNAEALALAIQALPAIWQATRPALTATAQA